MRRLFIICAIVLAGVATSGPAIADYVYPGRIIIGHGGGGGGGGGGSTGGNTTNAAMLGPECVLPQPIECECFTGLPVLEACVKSGVKIQCLTPDAKYEYVKQPEPVVIELGEQNLGALMCSGESKATAYIVLPKPG